MLLPLASMLVTTALAANGSNETADVSLQTTYPGDQGAHSQLDSRSNGSPLDTRRRDATAVVILSAVVVAVFVVMHKLTAVDATKQSFTEDSSEQPRAGDQQATVSSCWASERRASRSMHCTVASLVP